MFNLKFFLLCNDSFIQGRYLARSLFLPVGWLLTQNVADSVIRRHRAFAVSLLRHRSQNRSQFLAHLLNTESRETGVL
jgi:hypothetical protein